VPQLPPRSTWSLDRLSPTQPQIVEVSVVDGEVTVVHAGAVVARHRLVGPGEVAIGDEHYGGPRRSPTRAVRVRSGPEECSSLARGPR
jgi:hypothetical protein